MNRNEKLDSQTLVAAVIEEAKKLHVDHAEAFFEEGEELSIEVRNGEVENLKVARDAGLGVRVIQGNRLGYAYTSKLGREDVIETLKAALANAKAASEDPYYSLPQPAESYPQLDLGDPQMGQIPIEEKIELARQMEKSGRSFDPLVKLTEQVSYEEIR